MGGIVDEHLLRGATMSSAAQHGVTTARLPIQELTTPTPGKAYAPVLAVNQVFEAVHAVHQGATWHEALAAVLPTRKGFALGTPEETAAKVAAARARVDV